MTAPAPTLGYSPLPDPPPPFRLLMKPCGCPFLFACLLWASVELWASITPGNFIAEAFGMIFATLCFAYWGLRLILRLVLNRIYISHRRPLFERWKIAALALAICILTILALKLELPFQIAFRMNRSAFERIADTLLAQPPATVPTSIGPFKISKALPDPATHTVRFLFVDSGILGSEGIALYRGTDPPPTAAALNLRNDDFAYTPFTTCSYRIREKWITTF